MSYYKIIRGVRYDRNLLLAAESFTQGRGESRISLEEIQQLYQMALDGRGITDIEWRTLQYVAQQYTFTEPAKKWLDEQFELNNIGDLDKLIRRVVRHEFGLRGLKWKIDLNEVARQHKNFPSRGFIPALRGALSAFLRWGQGQLSLVAVVSRRDLAYNESNSPEEILKSYLNTGTLLLIPAEPTTTQAPLDFDLPESLDFQRFWMFGLHIPDLFPAQFAAFVLRDQPTQYSIGYFSRTLDLDNLIVKVTRQFAQFLNLELDIDTDEVQRQLALTPNQNFGNSLFAALHEGIFNGESSFSFRDFIMQEIWPDPDKSIQAYQREYIETGKLRLLSSPDAPAFPVPENFWPDTDDVWVFGLEMPRKTNVRFIITANRTGDIENASWNDGFIPNDTAFEDSIKHVVHEEFGLEGLRWTISQENYEAQRHRFGPDWRYFPGILRQALNTTLHDYLTPQSVFNIVKEVHRDEVDEQDFDDPMEYRAAIKHHIMRYLKSGQIEFLPIECSENNPSHGEAVEDNWLFSLSLPDLSDHGFFIIIPRWPDDEQLPYIYGVN